MPTKKTSTTKKSTKQKVAKRELIDTGTSKRYTRRNENGQFAETDEQGRSLSQDRRRKAKKTVKSGRGDRGDRQRRNKSS